MKIPDSELILNPDGSIYHLNLLPEDVAPTVITVGDPDRVDNVSRYFDQVSVKKQKREFKTHTGTYKGKPISVISTGIGAGNIDIVLNELDALKNIDFNTRKIKPQLESYSIIRIGTSGAIQPDIPVDSFIASTIGLGFDNLMHFYEGSDRVNDSKCSEAFAEHTDWNPDNALPYAIHANSDLLKRMTSEETIASGITATNVGFYAPQGRTLRLLPVDRALNKKMASFQFMGQRITNLEMETAAIYVMARLLGHRAISLNAILANRSNGTFSKDPESTIDRLIRTTLNNIAL